MRIAWRRKEKTNLDDLDLPMLSQPLGDDFLGDSGFELPDCRVLDAFADHLVQPLGPPVLATDSLMEFEIQTAQGGAVLEFGLIVDV